MNEFDFIRTVVDAAALVEKETPTAKSKDKKSKADRIALYNLNAIEGKGKFSLPSYLLDEEVLSIFMEIVVCLANIIKKKDWKLLFNLLGLVKKLWDHIQNRDRQQ